MSEKTPCSICNWELEDEEVVMSGYFGILPVAFCDTCFTCMLDMAKQVLDIKEDYDEDLYT